MGQPKVRCVICGAKNGEDIRCRICGGMLPGAATRKKEDPGGESFKNIVEAEVGVWREYEDGSLGSGRKSRRPSELPPVHAWSAAPGRPLEVDDQAAETIETSARTPVYEAPTTRIDLDDRRDDSDDEEERTGWRRMFRR